MVFFISFVVVFGFLTRVLSNNIDRTGNRFPRLSPFTIYFLHSWQASTGGSPNPNYDMWFELDKNGD